MAEALYELLVPHFDNDHVLPSPTDLATATYLLRLSTLSTSALTTTESQSLGHNAQSLLTSLRALASRSYRSINTSVEALERLQEHISKLTGDATALNNSLPPLDQSASNFANKYGKSSENKTLDRRRRIMRLGDNVERLSDMLELPTLLTSTIAASAGTGSTTTGSSMSSANAHYASALDIYAHIKRLQRLYPDSELVKSISVQAEDAMQGMTTNLITGLRAQSLKLAGGMRLVGLLRRVAPELDDHQPSTKVWNSGASEGSLGALFLVCRLANLSSTLEALEPLKDLADQETLQRSTSQGKTGDKNAWSAGQQTERYLKRYIELFREQCFAIISMYKSIFPASLIGPSAESNQDDTSTKQKLTMPQSTSALPHSTEEWLIDTMQKIPPALSTFTFHVIDMLIDTLRAYLPNVRDQSSRDSLLTQVLYCAASLGRLGGDFSMMLFMLNNEMEEDDDDNDDDKDIVDHGSLQQDPEWVQVTKRHRIAAGRLELLASGVKSGGGTS